MDPSAIDPETLLRTTRSVRRKLDLARPVDRGVILECLRTAIQAPNGADEEAWRFIVVTDEGLRRQIGELYRRANADFAATIRERASKGDEAAARKLESSGVFWDGLSEVPALVVACFERQAWFDESSPYALASAYGSVFPAIWNLQLALRLRGLGSCLVTSHLRFADEVAELLSLPGAFQQAGMIAVGHVLQSRFRPARRRPIEEVVRFERWEDEQRAPGR